MSSISTIYKLSVISWLVLCVSSLRCPVLECWYVQERPSRGGFSGGMSQEKSLLFIRADGDAPTPEQEPAADIDPSRIFHVNDPASTFCHSSLHPPEGSVTKPQCEMNPFTPQASMVRWAAALTESAQSPVYLDASWFSVSGHGLNKEVTLSNVMRAPSGSKEPSVILSVSSKTSTVRSRLGEPVLLDCGFWVDPSSPLHGSGFAVEWRYQFRGEGRLVLAYDSTSDRFAESPETGADLDVVRLYQTGNASLVLKEAQVRHSGTYICTVYLPHLLAQVAMELEIVEPPSLAVYPSPLPPLVPGQVVTLHCEASGFSPLALELNWEFNGTDGNPGSLGPARISGHRQSRDGTFSQSARLELEPGRMRLGRGGRLTCEAKHPGGTERVGVELYVIGTGSPSIEDAMAMVAVGLVLYGVIKMFYWMFFSADAGDVDSTEKKDN